MNFFIKVLVIMILLTGKYCFCQTNIVLDNLYHNTDKAYFANDSTFIYFNNFKSKKKLPLGEFKVDAESILSNFVFEGGNYEYFVKSILIKDSFSGNLILKYNYLLTRVEFEEEHNNLKFSLISEGMNKLECLNETYSNLSLIKSFLTDYFTLEIRDDDSLAKIIGKDCNVRYEEVIAGSIERSDYKDFVLLKSDETLMIIYETEAVTNR